MATATSYGTMTVTPYWRLWVCFFLYPATVALLVQLVLLPYVFPAWHAGHGLLVGGDWVLFHQVAADLAAQIRAQGWSAWQLRPQSMVQGSSGLLGAIYAVTVSEPWVLVPFSAALHATAALLLLQMVQRFIPDWRRAIWAVLPFLLYPSAMTWYAQVHKDGYFIAGAYCVVAGWVALTGLQRWQARPAAVALAIVVAGCALVWAVRPYGVQMLQGSAALVAALWTVALLARVARRTAAVRTALALGAAGWLLVVVMTPFTRGGLAAEAPPPPVPLIVRPDAVPVGGAIAVDWSGITRPSTSDWVGLFSPGSDDTARLAVQLTTGEPSGELLFRVPLTVAPGAYELRLYGNGTLLRLGTSAPFSVTPGATLAVEPTRVAAGQAVEARWSGVLPPSDQDWLGLFVPGSADTDRLAARTTTGEASGHTSLELPARLAPGTYELRLYARASFALLAVSAPLTVTPGATLSVTRLPTPAAAAIEVAWTDVPQPAARDWLGLFVPGSADTDRLAAWPTSGGASGTAALELPVDLPPGPYEVRLYANDSFQLLAVSAPFDVAAPAAAGPRDQLAALSASAAEGFRLLAARTLDPRGVPLAQTGGAAPPPPADGAAPPVDGSSGRRLEAALGEPMTTLWTQIRWVPTGWLPPSVESQLYVLALVREGSRFSFPDAATNIDSDVGFHSAADLIGYLPRAAQIALFAPFPNQWLGTGSLEGRTPMRRIAGVEMIGVYLALPFLPLALWRWRRRVELWVIVGFCVTMLLVDGAVITNVGTLYRLRYGFLMLLVALGIAGALTLELPYPLHHVGDLVGRQLRVHRQR